MTEVVAISGGAGALGAEVARALSRRGHKVALLDSDRHRARLQELAASLGHACWVAGDLAEPETWRQAREKVQAELGGAPSLAALAAGAWRGSAPLHADAGQETWRAMLRSNLETAYQGLRALLPAMVAARAGSIVLVGSRAGEQPGSSAGAAAYAASKAAVVALSRAAAAEVLEHGVRINAVLPSTLDTPANRAAMPKADPSRWVSLSSAAEVIAFLLGPDARDISGAAVPLYGRA